MTPALRPQHALELAFRLLDEHRATQLWVQDRLHSAYTRWNWPSAQRGIVTELVCGVVRRQRTLNVLLQSVLARPLSGLEPSLQTLLSLGAYQLAFLEHIPPYAAVNEAVELAKTLGFHRWTKLANGVLRSIARLCLPEFTIGPAADALPLGPARFRRLQKPILPAPGTDRIHYVAEGYSLPQWLVERWSHRMSEAELFAVAAACNTPPVTYLRVNHRRASVATVLARFITAGVQAEAIAESECGVRLIVGPPIPQLPGFAEGWFTPQDLTAMSAAVRLAPCAGDRVWDVCAAPGTKTTHLAELMDDHGEVVATDIDVERLQRIDENSKRLGLTSIRGRFVTPDGGHLPDGPFDSVLLDVPCSNTGVLHRRPEARWRLSPRDLVALPDQQLQLLKRAWARLRPGGRLLYSTCSIEPEENTAVIDGFAEGRTDVEQGEAVLQLPSVRGDGGYQALLIRKS